MDENELEYQRAIKTRLRNIIDDITRDDWPIIRVNMDCNVESCAILIEHSNTLLHGCGLGHCTLTVEWDLMAKKVQLDEAEGAMDVDN